MGTIINSHRHSKDNYVEVHLTHDFEIQLARTLENRIRYAVNLVNL